MSKDMLATINAITICMLAFGLMMTQSDLRNTKDRLEVTERALKEVQTRVIVLEDRCMHNDIVIEGIDGQ